MSTQYIYTLPAATQLTIMNRLQQLGLDNEDIQLALNSRIGDLMDTIDISTIM